MLINRLSRIILDDIPSKNPSLTTYFSLSTNEKSTTVAYEPEVMSGQLVALQLNKQIKKGFSEEKFIDDVLNQFQAKITEKEHLQIIKDIYFSDNKISPLSPLMNMAKPLDTKTKKTLVLFEQMMQKSTSNISMHTDLNFIEQDIQYKFEEQIEDKEQTFESHSYVNFLDAVFTKDFLFLLQAPHYFQTQIDRFLKLYLFTYSSQLALNLQGNPLAQPYSHELYFILNHEKASSERKNLTRSGYKTLIEKVRYMFPYLSLLETIAKEVDDKDLKYFHFKDIEENEENILVIDKFANLYRNAKSMQSTNLCSSSIEEAVDTLLKSTMEQFKTDKKAVIDRFILAFEKQISQPFFQPRGRSGKVLVMDQDTLLLLTNLAIGESKQLRFQDLMDEFKKRSVYFDPKSEDALLELYERVGNIDRKSDSGDAVYVKATI